MTSTPNLALTRISPLAVFGHAKKDAAVLMGMVCQEAKLTHRTLSARVQIYLWGDRGPSDKIRFQSAANLRLRLQKWIRGILARRAMKGLADVHGLRRAEFWLVHALALVENVSQLCRLTV